MRKLLIAVWAVGLLGATTALAQQGTATGAAGGAVTGAIVGGPVGAIIGGVAGAALGTAIDPPDEVRTYVVEQEAEPVTLQGDVVVGARLPEGAVRYYEVPNYEYRWAYVNGKRVLVNPSDNTIVYILE